MEDRKQFTFYASFHEAAQTLDALEDRGALYEAICAYALYGTEPHLNGTAAGMFALIRPNLDASRRKASNRLGKKQSDNKTTSKQHQTEKKREDESKEEKEKEKEKEKESEKENEYYILGGVGEPRADKPPRSRFIPPTVEEVKAYCQERRNDVDPQRFVDFYETKGWMVGKNKMKDWRAAVRTWEQRDGGRNQQKGEEDAGKYAGLVA